MQIARSFTALNNSQSQVALTIGSFDGVHAGHKHLFSFMKTLAPTRLVVTFETLPINYFCKGTIPQLTTLEQKLLLLEESGIDIVLLLPFDRIGWFFLILTVVYTTNVFFAEAHGGKWCAIFLQFFYVVRGEGKFLRKGGDILFVAELVSAKGGTFS